MLDCPISGTGAQAGTKDIVIYASGDRAAIRKLNPLFADFSRAAHDLGVFGNGSRMKYVANLLVAIHNVATAEAMVLGMKAGLPPEQILRLVSSGVGNSRIFELRAPMIARNRYDPATMKLSVWQKDMALIAAFAKAIGSPTPLFGVTAPLYNRALAAGHGAEDTAVVSTVLEQMAGLKRSKNSQNQAGPGKARAPVKKIRARHGRALLAASQRRRRPAHSNSNKGRKVQRVDILGGCTMPPACRVARRSNSDFSPIASPTRSRARRA